MPLFSFYDSSCMFSRDIFLKQLMAVILHFTTHVTCNWSKQTRCSWFKWINGGRQLAWSSKIGAFLHAYNMAVYSYGFITRSLVLEKPRSCFSFGAKIANWRRVGRIEIFRSTTLSNEGSIFENFFNEYILRRGDTGLFPTWIKHIGINNKSVRTM